MSHHHVVCEAYGNKPELPQKEGYAQAEDGTVMGYVFFESLPHSISYQSLLPPKIRSRKMKRFRKSRYSWRAPMVLSFPAYSAGAF